MPRRKGQVTTQREPVGDLRDPDSLYYAMQRFLAYGAERNFAAATLLYREMHIRSFISWCDSRGLTRPQEITRPILEAYQRYLFLLRKKNGEPLSFRTQHGRILPLRAWFKWLARQNHILYNPAAELELPRLEHRLPRHVLSVREVELVLGQPDLSNAYGVRDRAMLETLYSTGIRRMELANLLMQDIDPDRGTLMVRQGKGRKDRVVPIGERALAWIATYRETARPELATGLDTASLFLSNLGESFTPDHLSRLARHYVDAAKINKQGSCHLFRHTMATLMLENGADIRVIQAILGHAKLETTQIYTQVSIKLLKAIHTATHPGKPIQRRKTDADATPASLDSVAPADLTALLATLEQEASEEDGDT